jgi:hypothetical protein
MKSRPRSDRGNAMVAMLVAVCLCGALSAAVLTTNSGRQKEALTELAAMRALNLADAGADWGIAQVRIGNGTVPDETYTDDVEGSGSFTVRYWQCDEGADNNGDGVVDDSAEASLAKIVSTGTSGTISRSVEIIMRKAVEIPGFDGTIQINVEVPIIDMSSNSFTVSGNEHLIDGTEDDTRPAKYGVTSPAAIADLLSQILSKNVDQFSGLGGTPSVGQMPAIDLDTVIEQVMNSAGTLLQPGTHANLELGTPTEDGVVSAYCGGDLHLSGGLAGAGILCVDGDLQISGGLEWVGLILVRGKVTMKGGGSSNRLIGAMGVGEEVGSLLDTTTVALNGTIDMKFSSDAIALASQALAITAVMSWREVANPAP